MKLTLKIDPIEKPKHRFLPILDGFPSYAEQIDYWKEIPEAGSISTRIHNLLSLYFVAFVAQRRANRLRKLNRKYAKVKDSVEEAKGLLLSFE